MEYRKEKNAIYLRIDKGEEVVATIIKVCEKEQVKAGYFQGIGACDNVVLSTFIPEKGDYIHHHISGLLEMVSLQGNVTCDRNKKPFAHSHAIFSYLNENGEIALTAGHLQEANISYTGEIIITLAEDEIGRAFDENAGIEVWKLS